MKRIEYKRIMAMRYEYNQVHTTIENAITNGMSCVFNGRSGFSQPLFKLWNITKMNTNNGAKKPFNDFIISKHSQIL